MSVVVNSPDAWSARAAAASPYDAVGWTARGQADRFAAVLSHLRVRDGDRLLDFGSGTGAFSALLPADLDYLGFDWAPGMVDRARYDHPGRRFTSDYPLGKFDLVVAIGTFNLPGSKEASFHWLRHLWDSAGCRTLAASLYSGTDPRCLRYTVAEVERAARGLGYGAVIDRHRHNDLLLVAHR